jgi:methionyl-tRNA formyltransferase
VPVAWTIRNGDDEIGTTIHRMDADLDTGAILAQRTMPMGEYTDPDEFYGRLGPLHIDAFKEALAKLAAGEEGAVQGEGGYEGFFTDDDALLDFARPAAELHRLVWARRVECADAPVWFVKTEPVSVAGATDASSPARTTQ